MYFSLLLLLQQLVIKQCDLARKPTIVWTVANKINGTGLWNGDPSFPANRNNRARSFGPSQDESRIACGSGSKSNLAYSLLVLLTCHSSSAFLHTHTHRTHIAHTPQILSKNILRWLLVLRDRCQDYPAIRALRDCIYFFLLFLLILWERCCTYCIIAALSNVLFHNQWGVR